MLVLADVLRAKNNFLPPPGITEPTKIRLSSATLRAIEDSYRAWEIKEARRMDTGPERLMTWLFKDSGASSFEEKARMEHQKKPYSKAGDKLYGMTIEIDDSIPNDTIKVE